MQKIEDLELATKRTCALYKVATMGITHVSETQGFIENKEAAVKGGEVAGKARKGLEIKTGKRVASQQNYLQFPQNRKRLK